MREAGLRARRLRLGRPARAERGASWRPSRRSSACTRSPSRTRSTPTSAPSSSGTATRCSSPSSRSGTSTRTTRSRPARSTCSSGDDFVITVRHGAGSRAAHGPPRPRGAGPRSSRTARPRSSTPCATRSSTATCRSMTSLEEDVDEVETSVFSDRAHQRLGPHLHPQARDRRGAPRGAAAARADATASPPAPCPASTRTPRRSSATSLDHLTKVAETVDGLDALLSTAFDAHLAQISVQQNEDMRKISAGVAPRRRADPDRRRLRHELRPHARAATGTYGYPLALGPDGAHLAAVLWMRFKRSGWL